MKKIIYLLFFLFSLSGYSQFPQGFENSMSLPPDWMQIHDGAGSTKWTVSNLNVNGQPPFVCEGSNAAFISNQGVGVGNTSYDYLVTPQFKVPLNGEIRFFTRQNFAGDYGTIYQLKISTASDPTILAAYTTVQEWTELELNIEFDKCQEQIVDLSAYKDNMVYVAFVRVFEQTESGVTGDRLFLDNVNVVSKCLEPSALIATNISGTTATLNWSDTNGSKWDVFVVNKGVAPTNEPTDPSVSKPFLKTGLTPDTEYDFYVRSVCDQTNSKLVGPFTFKTYAFGATCGGPINITQLPYQNSDNTGNFLDLVDGPQNAAALCGASPSGTNFLDGNDVFYSFTAAKDGLVSFKLTPTAANSSIFIYGDCAITAPCLAGIADVSSNVRLINNFPVTAGTTYHIVISSSKATQTFGYTFVMQEEHCSPPSSLTANNFTTATAQLSWANTSGATKWEVAVQNLGDPVPAIGDEIETVENNPAFQATGLKSGTKYQYFVRSVCADGSYSSWAGPYAFNTLICDAPQCSYVFKMTDLGGDGWKGNAMQIRQNDIVVATIGSTIASGSGPISVTVPLCENVPFDVYWSASPVNSKPEECVVSIINSKGQTLYTKKAGVSGVNQIVYGNTVNCSAVCNITPDTLTAIPSSHTADLGWNSPATSAWDVYVVPQGSPAPDALTTPTYPNVTTNPFQVSGLLADNCYTFYVRTVCSPDPSAWSVGKGFCTIATCPKPKSLVVPVANITQNSAQLNWVKGVATDTKWEILLVKAVGPLYGTPAPPAINPVLNSGDIFKAVESPAVTSPYTITGLEQATIYYYYIRTVCSDDDKSTWAGPVKFNTTTCDSTSKCSYSIIMTDSGNDGWNDGRMVLRHNGIEVTTFGSSLTTGGPEYLGIFVCPGVDFDIYWKTAGTKPQEIGVKIIDPFGDPIYEKLPGSGTPSTVLFSSKGNCTAPTCKKPDALKVVSTASNSATLSWTETGTATKWEVYVVPTGGTPPANGSAVSTGQPGYYITDVNTNTTITITTDSNNVTTTTATFTIPVTAVPLNPSTVYDYYVRALCSDSDRSNWNLTTPKSFMTTPLNDECDKAIVVQVNDEANCTLSAQGNTKGATATTPGTNPVCSGYADDDVWFSFTAKAKTHIIDLKNIVGGTTDLNHTLYKGSACGTLEQLYCSNPNTSVARNLTIGEVYKIRVYTNGNELSKSAIFDVCITTPAPVVNDECTGAVTLTANLDLECVQFGTGTLTAATDSLVSNTCVGTSDDDVWYKFVATSVSHHIFLSDIVGTTADLNFSVYKGACGALELLSCSPAAALTSAYNKYEIGQTYYVRVWSNSAQSQAVDFKICIGTIPPPITVNPIDQDNYNPQRLVEDVLFGTKCAKIGPVSYSTGTNFSTVNGIGYFNKGFSNFKYEDGIVLSTGAVASIPGPNTSTLSEGEITWPGDSDLEAIIGKQTGQPMNSKNASKLEFDFVAITKEISFNFLFASEEYGGFQCTFPDAFAFLLTNKSTKVTTNLAVIPDTSIPVSVVTVRDKKYNSACSSENAKYFDKFYGQGGLPAISSSINFNGMTKSLVAKGEVKPGDSYHIKLVVADRSDNLYDTAVFIEGGSFDLLGDVKLGDDMLVSTQTALCFGETSTLDSGLTTDNFDITWTKDGEIIPNATGSQLIVSAPGEYAVKAMYKNSSCALTDSIIVEYYDNQAAGEPNNMSECSTSGTATFDLTKNSSIILNPFSGNHTVTYFTSSADANNNVNPITNPASFVNTTASQVIYCRVDNVTSGCYQIVDFTVTVQPLADITIENSCSGNTYELSAKLIGNTINPDTLSYVWATTDGEYVPSNASNTIILKKSGTYSVKVTTTEGCSSEQTITVSDITCTIPKGISPDGDGKNDNLDLTTLNLKRLEIFNRYGSEVYSKDDYTKEWNGQTTDGAELPDGTYFYLIHYADNKTDKGWIYINRKH